MLSIITWSLTLVFMISGCALHRLPEPIRKPPATEITIAEARKDASAVVGKKVRWGGAIIKVENRKHSTWIELVARPLSRDGEPRDVDTSGGRFIAKIQGFVDPAVYQVGRLLTVVGVLTEPISKPIGKFHYQYPVVTVSTHYLWPLVPKYPEPYPDYYPYYYDPFWYYPWYPPHYPYHPRYRRK